MSRGSKLKCGNDVKLQVKPPKSESPLHRWMSWSVLVYHGAWTWCMPRDDPHDGGLSAVKSESLSHGAMGDDEATYMHGL